MWEYCLGSIFSEESSEVRVCFKLIGGRVVGVGFGFGIVGLIADARGDMFCYNDGEFALLVLLTILTLDATDFSSSVNINYASIGYDFLLLLRLYIGVGN